MTLEIKRRASMVLASIVAVVFAMTALLAGSAQAEEEGPTAVELGNIKVDQDSTITVHKHAEPSSGPAGNGTVLDPEPSTAKLSGVEFILQKITCVKVTESTDWPIIAGLKVDATGTVKKPDGTECTVDTAETTQQTVDGVTTFDVRPGVFLVTEGEDKGNEKPGDNNITAKAAPFIVTVPFPSKTAADPNKREWNYNVHVYPKNSVTGITKDVDDSGALVAGDPVDWTVEATVPAFPPCEPEDPEDPQSVPENCKELESFVIRDTFDSRLKYGSASVTGLEFAAEDELVADDYSVVSTTLPDGKTQVDVVFTNTGIAKLQNNGAKKVQVVFKTSVKEDADIGNGDIPNTATVYVNDPGYEHGVDSEDKHTYWGELKITKTDKDNTKKLSGAEFKVYTENPDENSAATSVATLVTDENGVASVILKKGTYYVKETKAPAGYVLDTEVKTVTIDPTASPATVKVGLPIKNVKSDVPDLPLTGASGQLLMMVGGGAVILLAAGTGLVAIKRRRA